MQVQFEEMSGWSADSDAAAMLSNLGIGEEHHFTLMADLEAKLRFVFFWQQALLESDLLIMDEPNDFGF
jgi:ATPase subunit of ABC transporter with duplicated ATPase domains